MDGLDFSFPFEPYGIQLQFMQALYRCIDDGNIGIFESPTGTGKSLSIICASLTWLRHQQRQRFNPPQAEGDTDEPDWMVKSARKEKRQDAVHAIQALEARLQRAREKERKSKQRYEDGRSHPKKRKTGPLGSKDTVSDDEFLLDDYASDDARTANPSSIDGLGLSKETQSLLKKTSLAETNVDDEGLGHDDPTIFYCSRTHSQLSQFSAELRRVKLPPIIDEKELMSNTLKHLTLGSRKNLCINPKVLKLRSATAINEKCMDLQKSGVSETQKCPYLPSKDNEHLVNQFRDLAVAEIRDIEDLGALGKQLEICPYYASRSAIELAEIVTLPYPLILQKSARDALGISLKNHVVIIDEAHNLMDAICGIYSCSISLSQLNLAREQLMVYLKKFAARLKGKNRVYVTQTVRLIDSLIAYLQSKDTSDAKDGICKPAELLAGKGVDQINLFKLNTYIQESRLARKVDGYNSQIQEDEKKTEKATAPVLMQVQSFMLALMNPSTEGRFFYASDDSGLHLKYMLLDPTKCFQEVVEEARAVILAGGTMSPMEDYRQHLFSYIPESRIQTLTCSHIVPPSSLVVYPVSKDRRGTDFSFTFEKRSQRNTIVAAGQALLEFISIIPDGVVAFFPSYGYLATCMAAWQATTTPTGSNLWKSMQAAKPVFWEQHKAGSDGAATAPAAGRPAAPGEMEGALAAYTAAVRSPAKPHGGALLLAVISGSLSEGINFSDELGRGVLVFGLPYPNPRSAEWTARREHVAGKVEARLAEEGRGRGEAARRGADVAREFYENATMRAVAQAVGRAIRHRSDYAAVLLVDGRYEGERIRGKLPGWMWGSVRAGCSMGEIQSGLREFFKAKAAGQ